MSTEWLFEHLTERDVRQYLEAGKESDGSETTIYDELPEHAKTDMQTLSLIGRCHDESWKTTEDPAGAVEKAGNEVAHWGGVEVPKPDYVWFGMWKLSLRDRFKDLTPYWDERVKPLMQNRSD